MESDSGYPAIIDCDFCGAQIEIRSAEDSDIYTDAAGNTICAVCFEDGREEET